MSSQQGFDNSVEKGFPASILFDNPLDSLMPRDTDDLEKLARKYTEAYVRVNFMGEGTSSPGGSVATARTKGIRRRKKTYTSNAVDQTLDLDDEVGISEGKVKSYALNLIANGEPQKTVRLTNSLNERDNFGASLQGVFLNDLGENEYVSEIGRLFLKATDLNNRNIVELTWSEEV